MRYIILFLFLIGQHIHLFAQNDFEWLPVGATFEYTQSFVDGDRGICSLTVEGDTFLLDRVCKIISGDCAISGADQIILCGAGSRVYQFADEAFHLLYDFDVDVCDSLNIWVPYSSGNEGNFYTEVVDSTGIVQIQNQSYRAYWTTPLQPFSGNAWSFNRAVHIERIGNLAFLLPEDELSENPRGLLNYTTNDFSFSFECFNRGDCLIATTKRCGDLIDDTAENFEIINLSIYPNPAQNDIVIYHPIGAWKRGYLYDRVGRLIQKFNCSTQNQTTIAASHLSNGIYYIRLSDGKNWRTLTVLIEQE